MVTSSTIVEGKLPCPFCPSSDAYHVYSDGHGFCFSCEGYNPPQGTVASEPENYTFEYIPTRGISKSTLQLYRVLTKIDQEGKPISTGFRYPTGDIKVRLLDHKEFYWKKAEENSNVRSPGLFGQDLFTPGESKSVVITEGEYDALSTYEVLRIPSVSVSSSTSAERDCISARSWLSGFDRIYLAFDNDANGRAATDAVAKLFDYDKVFHVKFTSRKDANEYLQAGEGTELKNIWLASKRYKPDNIISCLSEFDKELAVAPQRGAAYPFDKLTEMTYGIRTGEIVLITAQEKVGKTEFMHAILHKLLKEKPDDNIAGLFIEETRTRTLQAIAGIELGRPVHLPDSGCTQSEIMEAVHKVVGRDDRLHLYTHSRSDDPESILDTLRFLAAARSCKYVLFDHPGMAVFGLGEDSERILLDALSTKSALMVKELDFGLIVVSHVNDFGQTRGSRYIGKVCDVRIDLTRDTAAADPAKRNTLNVTIPYQRYSSNSGPVGKFAFSEKTQRYIEVANDNDPQPSEGAKAA